MVFSVILCPYGGSSYFHTNDVGLGKENWFPSKVIPWCFSHPLMGIPYMGKPCLKYEEHSALGKEYLSVSKSHTDRSEVFYSPAKGRQLSSLTVLSVLSQVPCKRAFYEAAVPEPHWTLWRWGVAWRRPRTKVSCPFCSTPCLRHPPLAWPASSLPEECWQHRWAVNIGHQLSGVSLFSAYQFLQMPACESCDTQKFMPHMFQVEF